MNKISPARLAAFEILKKVEREKSFSSALLPVYEEKLSRPDRALCHQITLGVLRRQIYLDRIIQSFSRTKISKFDLEIRLALRIGLFQLVFLDKIPDFSAIDESVNLVHLAKKRSASGLVNAILRAATRQKTFDFEYADEFERVSVETSHPRWLIERWARAFSFETAEETARADNETPALAFRLTVKADQKTVETMRKLGIEFSVSEIALNGFRVEKTGEMLFAYSDDGKIYFQEESSQLVGEAVYLQPGESFLDVCAAPGSKFTQIAGNAKLKIKTAKATGNELGKKVIEDDSEVSQVENRNPKSLAVAGDLHWHRLRFLRRSASNQAIGTVDSAVYDAEKDLPFAPETFDCILLDAPCSGTGTIRHNPEIRYFLTEKDFPELQAKQLGILRNASKVLKRGGRVVYSTCSLETEENEAVVEKFLESADGFEKVQPNLPEKFITGKGFARTVPARDGSDGFFIAVLKKR